MAVVLGQASVAEVCGEGDQQDALCRLVLEVTGRAELGRAVAIGSTFLWIVVTLLVAYLLTRLIRRIVARYARRIEDRITRRLDRALERGELTDTQRFRTRRLQRLQAVVGVVRGVIGVVIWTTALVIVADLLGLPLQPLLAGAGLAGIVIGFGAQQLVRDVLAGIAMLIEDQYGVGDWIEVDGRIGQVERVGLRSTAFRDMDGVVHHVLNGAVEHVGNLSQEWARATFDVPIALDADVGAAKAIIHKVATDLARDAVWGRDVIGDPEVWGVQHYGPDGLRIRVVIATKPLRNWDLTRQLRERLKHAFDVAGIRMPGQLLDIGGQSRGYAVLQARPGEEGVRREPHRGTPAADHLDRPSAGMSSAAPEDRSAASDQPSEEEPPDATTALRLEQGPRPRPD